MRLRPFFFLFLCGLVSGLFATRFICSKFVVAFSVDVYSSYHECSNRDDQVIELVWSSFIVLSRPLLSGRGIVVGRCQFWLRFRWSISGIGIVLSGFVKNSLSRIVGKNMLASILTAPPAMSISTIQRSCCEVSCVEVVETFVSVLVSFEAMVSHSEEKCSKRAFARNMAFTHVPGSHTYFLMVSAKAIDVSAVYCEG